jgi:Tfp pilus assembly protein PilF
MQSSRDYSSEQLASSYKLWLQAAIEKLGKQSDLLAALRRVTPGSAEQKELRSVTPAMLRQWVTRGSLPSEPNLYIKPRLVSVIEAQVSAAPKGAIFELSFEQLVSALHEARQRSSKKGKADSELDKFLHERDYVTHEVQTVDYFQIEKLGLGSWFSNGNLPNYCARDIDSELTLALEHASTRLITLSGPPKAGKTRSLVENLKRSKFSKSKVYWLNPYSDSVEEIILRLEENEKNPNIIVLDDIQRFKFDKSGLSYPNFQALMSKGLVIATVHESKLTRWSMSDSQAENGSGLFPSKRVSALLSETNIGIASKLTIDELANAERELKVLGSKDSQIRHLAAWLASVDELRGRTTSLLSGTTYEQSMFAALIDLRLVYPQGSTIDKFMEFAEIEFRLVDPHSPWFAEQARVVLSTMTSGLTAGSPHAIMVRTPDNPELYMMSDFIWEKFRPNTWPWAHLQLGPALLIEASRNCFFEGLFETTLEILGSTAFDLSFREHMILARSMQYVGDLENAEVQYRIAANSEDPEAIDFLLTFLYSRGRFEEALEIAKSQNYDSNPEGRYKLGVIYHELGLTDLAELEYEKCGDLPEALATRAWSAFGNGKCEQGEDLAQKALRLGEDDPTPRQIVGRLFKDMGRFSEALEAMEYSNLDAQTCLHLGQIYFSQSNFRGARYYFEEAIKIKKVLASRNEDFDGASDSNGCSLTNLETQLALALFALGGEAEFLSLMKKLSENRHPPAVAELALYFDSKKKKKEFIEVVTPLADCGTAKEFEYVYQSIRNFKQDFIALLGSYAGQNELSVIEMLATFAFRDGDMDSGRRLTELAASKGSKSARYYSSVYNAQELSKKEIDDLVVNSSNSWTDEKLYRIFYKRKDFTQALEFAERAVARGDDLATGSLGWLYQELGQGNKARLLYEAHPFSSAALGSLAYMHQFDNSDLENAAKLYLRAWNLGDENRGADYGYMLIKQGKFEEAQDVLWRLADKGNPFAINNLKRLSIYSRDVSISIRLAEQHPKHLYLDLFKPLEAFIAGQVKAGLALITQDLVAGPNENLWWLLEELHVLGYSELAFEVASALPDAAWSCKLWLAHYFALEANEDQEFATLTELKGLGYSRVQERLAELATKRGEIANAISLYRDAQELNPDDFRFQNEIKEKIVELERKNLRKETKRARPTERKPAEESTRKNNARKRSLN